MDADWLSDRVAMFAELLATSVETSAPETTGHGDSSAVRSTWLPLPRGLDADGCRLVSAWTEPARAVPDVPDAVAPVLSVDAEADGQNPSFSHERYAAGTLERRCMATAEASTITAVAAAIEKALTWAAANGLSHRFLAPRFIGADHRGWRVTGFGLVDGVERHERWLAALDRRSWTFRDEASRLRASPAWAARLVRTARSDVHPDDRLGFVRVVTWMLLRCVEPSTEYLPEACWHHVSRMQSAALLRVLGGRVHSVALNPAIVPWARRVLDERLRFSGATFAAELGAVLG
jgi:hypothetical protein